MLDLLVAGECFYKVTIPKIGETPDIEVLNPIDVFYEKNVEIQTLKIMNINNNNQQSTTGNQQPAINNQQSGPNTDTKPVILSPAYSVINQKMNLLDVISPQSVEIDFDYIKVI